MRGTVLILAGVVAVGAAVRLAGGVPLLQTELQFSAGGAPAPSGAAAGVTADAAQAAAAAFYSCLAKGDYQEAWKVSLEPDWSGAAGASSYLQEVTPSAHVSGWTSESAFVRRCEEDIGPGVKLNAVEVAPLPSPPRTPEAGAASALGATRLFGVRASGHLLGACMIYHWERDLVVAQVGGAFKVLLPGTKAARSSFHQEWFSDLSLIGTLRAAGK
jgi:hypothetical protein